MKASLRMVSVVILCFAGTGMAAIATANDAAVDIFAVSCTTGTSTATAGGYLVKKQCNSNEVGGIGTMLAEAHTNAENFGAVGAAGGRYCRLPSTTAFASGYLANFSCGGNGNVSYPMSGVGNTLTNAGANALGFAELEAAGGRRCRSYLDHIQATAGGFLVDFSCTGSTTYRMSGAGSTITDAGVNALRFAELEAAGGRLCRSYLDYIHPTAGGYLVDFSCRGTTSLRMSGVGTTMTDAGTNAAGFAEHEAAGGRRCSTTLSSIRAFPGGYEVRFTCSGLAVYGSGSTLTAAGQDALAKAR